MDRCDACGVRASQTWQKQGAKLTLCGHHGNTLADALEAAGFRFKEPACV